MLIRVICGEKSLSLHIAKLKTTKITLYNGKEIQKNHQMCIRDSSNGNRRNELILREILGIKSNKTINATQIDRTIFSLKA